MLVQSAIQLLRLVRAQSDSLLVPFSGGKDSSAVLDLAIEHGEFKRVQPYYFYRVANLRVADQMLARTEKRYGLKIIRLPAPDLTEVYRHAFLQPHWIATDHFAEQRKLTGPDVENWLRRQTGIQWVAMGKRCSDSLPRRAMLRQCGGINYTSRVLYPIWLWNRLDILSYLRIRRIPKPLEFGRKEQGGLDFHVATLRFLKKNHPEDWQRYQESFPYAETAIISADLRRERKALRHKTASR
jgi:phosphoadenosine phosphosulfate reductase